MPPTRARIGRRGATPLPGPAIAIGGVSDIRIDNNAVLAPPPSDWLMKLFEKSYQCSKRALPHVTASRCRRSLLEKPHHVVREPARGMAGLGDHHVRALRQDEAGCTVGIDVPSIVEVHADD